jgi:hypothetical protein
VRTQTIEGGGSGAGQMQATLKTANRSSAKKMIQRTIAA